METIPRPARLIPTSVQGEWLIAYISGLEHPAICLKGDRDQGWRIVETPGVLFHRWPVSSKRNEILQLFYRDINFIWSSKPPQSCWMSVWKGHFEGVLLVVSGYTCVVRGARAPSKPLILHPWPWCWRTSHEHTTLNAPSENKVTLCMKCSVRPCNSTGRASGSRRVRQWQTGVETLWHFI